jgi:hypothetical protein
MTSSLTRVLPILGILASTSLVANTASAQQTPAKTDPKKKSDKKDEKPEEKKTETATVSTSDVTAPASPDAVDKRAVVVALEGGFTRPDIGGLSDSTNFDKTAANGGLYGVLLGARLNKLILGLHFRGHATTEFTLWSLMAEVGYTFSSRPLQPIVSAHLGYIWSVGIERAVYQSALPALNTLPPDVSVKGAVFGVEGAALYWLTKNFGLGPFLGVDLAYYSRGKVPLPQSLLTLPTEIKENPLYTDSGSGLGYTINIGIRGALDLGI